MLQIFTPAGDGRQEVDQIPCVLGADCPSVLVLRELRTVAVEQTAPIVAANLPQIERVIVERGNALFSLTPGRPIRAELLPLGLVGPTAATTQPE